MNTRIDEDWLTGFLVDFLRTPTEVPTRETEIKPGDPRIVSAVDTLLLPAIKAMKPDEVRRHRLGDVCARFGPATDDGLLILTYVVSQHANLMDDPHSGDLVEGMPFGISGMAAWGQGATQNKGSLASAFAAVRALSATLSRPVWLAVNTEGESSHGGSMRLLDNLGVTAAAGLLAIGTDQKISVGNRGRVDVEIFVKGTSAHSSQAPSGRNAIEGMVDVVAALRTMPLPPPHPQLGSAAVTPYQVRCRPIAPHTLPEECAITADRRLLPGETPRSAVHEMERHLGRTPMGELDVTATMGKWMLPCEVAADSAIVRALSTAIQKTCHRPAETIVSRNTFDAGYACSKGIPTPMFGPGRRVFSGQGMLGVDAVAVQDCFDSANAILQTITELCS